MQQDNSIETRVPPCATSRKTFTEMPHSYLM